MPGGFVEEGETVELAAVREVREETGLRVELVRLVGVYSGPERDPRGDIASVVYLARPVGGKLTAANDADDVLEVGRIDPRSVKLAFDHREVIDDAAMGEGADTPRPAAP